MRNLDELNSRLTAIAARLSSIRSICTNEESTKLFLVFPVLNALGYDVADPTVVQPEFAADFRDGVTDRVDYAIMRDGVPAIAVECKRVGADLSANRGQLRAYFTALNSVRLGILTNGLRFEFFVDSENANVMDEDPFVTLDMDAAAQGGVPADVLEALGAVTKEGFHPSAIAEFAELRLTSNRLRAVLMQEVREPSPDFCRVILKMAGVENVRRARIESLYSSMVRNAFEEAFVLPVLEHLRTSHGTGDGNTPTSDVTEQRIVTTDRELAVYRYACRRLAYLAGDEFQFAAIEHVHYRDYVGKFAVFYRSIYKGRLFDFIEGGNGYDKYIFPEPFGEILTSTMADIDRPLKAVFAQRIGELGSAQPLVVPSPQKIRA
jgi:hypothetical protein